MTTVDTTAPLGDRFESEYWSPGAKYEAYLTRIRELLTSEERTVRDVYYALEARGFPAELREANTSWAFKYRYVKRAVKKGRRAGFIDPSLIVDTSRQTEAPPKKSHSDPKQFTRQSENHLSNGYYRNFWESQDSYVEVWLEKASLVSVLRPICEELNVRLEATRGDWSDSKVYEATSRLKNRLESGRNVRILYLGDFNPSGLHAPVSVQETMGHYGIEFPFRADDSGDRWYFDVWPFDDPASWPDGGDMMFERVALNLEHIREYDLPENPNPSSTDKDRQLRERFMTHASGGRDTNIELNALKEYHRDDLEQMLREAIEKHIDDDAREEHEKKVAQMQETIGQAASFDYSVFE